MTAEEMKLRTEQFALRIMKLVDALPKKTSAEVIGRQLLRSATSVAANYRAACRGRSKAEFAAKLGIVEEEADESCFWLEMLGDSELLPAPKLQPLRKEADELTAIVVASIKTARINAKNPKSQICTPKSK
ncbi:MAG: four helix bundle protein [Opitutaceae bacterium]|jgi:four helix bundle protein|nr:four helix bundle protein [Opitutaceae bacterium]